MRQMDIAGGIVAEQRALDRVATGAVDGFTFDALDETGGTVGLGGRQASCYQEKRVPGERQGHHGRKITNKGHCMQVPPSQRLFP